MNEIKQLNGQPRIFISAGEASGDLHAGALARELLKLRPGADIYGMGGEQLQAAGARVLFDIKEHSVMGLVGVIKKLPALFALKSEIEKVLDEQRPDCVITIDYSEFNTYVVAKAAKQRKIPILSFIPPSAWIWRKGRAKYLAKTSSLVATIFPFENEVYLAAGANAHYVGHPLLDVVKSNLTVEEARRKAGKVEGQPLILLLPGSRAQEIEKMLPLMLDACKLIYQRLPGVNFCLPRASSISCQQLQEYLQDFSMPLTVTNGDNYDIMKVADVALATSGTVTLEAALCGLPSVIVYKTAPLNAFIFRKFINIASIGLPNIVMGRQVLPELLQQAATAENLATEALELLTTERRRQVAEDLRILRERLGKGGAIHRVAELALLMIDSGRAPQPDECPGDL